MDETNEKIERTATSIGTKPVAATPKANPVTKFVGLETTLFVRQKRSFVFATGVALVLIFGIVGFAWNQVSGLEREMKNQATLTTAQFPEKDAAQWLVKSRSDRTDWQVEARFQLQAFINNLLTNRSMRYALLVDEKSQEIKGHSVARLVGELYKPLAGEEVLQGNADLTGRRFEGEGHEPVVDFAYPIIYGPREEKKRVGTLHFGFSYAEIEKARQRETRLLPFLSFLILLGAIGSVVVKDRKEKKTETKKREAAPVLQPETDRLGPYILEKKIAAGGMGELFLARKEVEQFKMRVAIKRILPERADDEVMISSLLDEANLASQLRHSNIVTVHDFGNIAGSYFIAMEFIEGTDLSALIKKSQSQIPVGHALYIVAEAAKGLDYAHKKKDDFSGQSLAIVHRDISPNNILISFAGEVKITDFGIAKAAQRATKHTVDGMIKGKLFYLSPEQATGGNIDHRSDLFSLGLVLYELLSGRRGFKGETSHEILMQVARGDVSPIGNVSSDLPLELARIVMKSLDRDPAKRQQDAAELIDEIGALVRTHPEFRCDREELGNFVRNYTIPPAGKG